MVVVSLCSLSSLFSDFSVLFSSVEIDSFAFFLRVFCLSFCPEKAEAMAYSARPRECSSEADPSEKAIPSEKRGRGGPSSLAINREKTAKVDKGEGLYPLSALDRSTADDEAAARRQSRNSQSIALSPSPSGGRGSPSPQSNAPRHSADSPAFVGGDRQSLSAEKRGTGRKATTKSASEEEFLTSASPQTDSYQLLLRETEEHRREEEERKRSGTLKRREVVRLSPGSRQTLEKEIGGTRRQYERICEEYEDAKNSCVNLNDELLYSQQRLKKVMNAVSEIADIVAVAKSRRAEAAEEMTIAANDLEEATKEVTTLSAERESARKNLKGTEEARAAALSALRPLEKRMTAVSAERRTKEREKDAATQRVRALRRRLEIVEEDRRVRSYTATSFAAAIDVAVAETLDGVVSLVSRTVGSMGRRSTRHRRVSFNEVIVIEDVDEAKRGGERAAAPPNLSDYFEENTAGERGGVSSSLSPPTGPTTSGKSREGREKGKQLLDPSKKAKRRSSLRAGQLPFPAAEAEKERAKGPLTMIEEGKRELRKEAKATKEKEQSKRTQSNSDEVEKESAQSQSAAEDEGGSVDKKRRTCTTSRAIRLVLYSCGPSNKRERTSSRPDGSSTAVCTVRSGDDVAKVLTGDVVVRSHNRLVEEVCRLEETAIKKTPLPVVCLSLLLSWKAFTVVVYFGVSWFVCLIIRLSASSFFLVFWLVALCCLLFAY